MNEKIHYDDFVEQIAQESGYDNDTVREYLSNMFETIVTQSTKGKLVKLRNFGSFQPRWYKARRGINPQTKQPIEILPHYHIHFASSKVLQNALNEEPSKYSLAKRILLAFAVLMVLLFVYFNTLTKEPLRVKTVEQVQQVEPIQTAKPVIKEIMEPQIEETVVIPKKPITLTSPSKASLYPGTHIVTANESLSSIGLKVYGNKGYWPLIYTANIPKVSNPDLILRDNSLIIPDKKASKQLYSSYMDVHNAYMQRDLMSKSFWILCEGSHFMGKNFQMYLKEKLIPIEYAIIKKCSTKGLN